MLFGSIQHFDLFATMELRAYDLRARLLPGATAADDILLVLVDQSSLEFFAAEDGQAQGWPWPRSYYIPLVQYLRSHGVRAIAFDILFTESSVYGIDDDTALGDTLRGRPDTVLAMGLSFNRGAVSDSDKALLYTAGQVSIPGSEGVVKPEARPRLSVVLPVPELAGNARLGNTIFQPDLDGVFRRLPLFSSFEGRQYLSLFTAAARLFTPVADIVLTSDGITFDGVPVPGPPGTGHLLRYRGPAGTYRSFSAAAVIQAALLEETGQPAELDGAVFNGTTVFIGLSAPGLMDLRPTPMDAVFPGVEIQATAMDCLLHNDFITPVAGSALIVAILALITVVATTMISRASLQAALLVMLLAGMQTAALLAYRAGYDLPQVVPFLTIAGGFLTAVIVGYAREGRQKAFIKSAFKHYLSPQVIEQILDDPDRLALGGERRELTIFFSDLESFTAISERMEPQDLTNLLNDYLSAMSAIILESGGTVDKYEGDAIIAFWNAPLALADHAARGVRAAIACQRRLRGMQDDFTRRAGRPLRMRIGLHTGMVVVGNLGSHQRFDYTVLGDAANLASRLEGANKAFGSTILVSADTWLRAGLPQSLGRCLGAIRVKGRAEPVTVYMVNEEPLPSEREDQFTTALACFRRGDFQEAMERFSVLSG
ncbi:adenylate/guanylate cyclase domain-containing protein, partial [bacterium]|nr:adenylate/guanylate cyclase domain-containing protein [candidate division CSSED10-310 bacterium]